MGGNVLEKKDILTNYVNEYLYLYYGWRADRIQMVNEELFEAVKDKGMLFENNVMVHLERDFHIEKVVFERKPFGNSFSESNIYRESHQRSREAYINCYLRLVWGTSLNYLTPETEKGFYTCITIDFRRIVLDISEGKISIVSQTENPAFVTDFNRSYNY